jgi:RNase P/RNase MRP subunit p29
MNHPEEFIGLEIMVVSAKNPSLARLQGKIIDETKNSFKIIGKDKKEKTILKEGCIFIINNNKIIGNDIIQRPEDRIKARR